MLWLYRFLKGYVNVKAFGEFPERLINKCAKENLRLWNIRYIKNAITFNVSIYDFRRIFLIRKGLKISVKIKKKIGLPFIIHRYRYRYGIIIGFILFCAVLMMLSSFIWEIKIIGNSKVSRKQILLECEKIGITIGANKNNINPKNSAQRLLINNKNLAWCSLNMEGTVLTVNVTEIKPNNRGTVPCNLKAKTDGKIVKIEVTKGNNMVKVGDNVRKGELLVSGIIEQKNSTEFICSKGEIYAETEKEYRYFQKFVQNNVFKTKEVKSRKVLNIFGFKIPMFFGKLDESFRRGKLQTKSIISKSIPLEIYSRQFTKTTKNTMIFSKAELKVNLRKCLKSDLKRENIKEYEIIEEIFQEEKEGIKGIFKIKTIENIAAEDKLLIKSKN